MSAQRNFRLRLIAAVKNLVDGGTSGLAQVISIIDHKMLSTFLCTTSNNILRIYVPHTK